MIGRKYEDVTFLKWGKENERRFEKVRDVGGIFEKK